MARAAAVGKDNQSERAVWYAQRACKAEWRHSHSK
jgi:hypothetical protein